LIKKGQPFYRGVEVENAFKSLKTSFTTAPLLIHTDASKPFVLQTNVFDFVIGVIL